MTYPFKICKKCNHKKSINEYYKHKETKDGYLGKCKDCCKNDNTKNRKKNIEHYKVACEKKKGRLKNENCFICGEIKTEAHHSDYRKPLKIIWVCKQHHEEIHHYRS